MAEIVKWPQHLRYNCPPTCKGCGVCDGGLYLCARCGGAEGGLPTDCPGERMSTSQSQDVYDGKLNYLQTRGWVSFKSWWFKSNG